MTDIVERLRFPMGTGDYDYRTVELMREAAHEIERLQAELARIRGLPRLAALDAEIERLRAALNELTTEITQSSILMDNISLPKFERALSALNHE
jgi:uncharacterized small protein (DUF1192 family)